MKKLVLTLFVFCIMFSFTALNAQNPTRHTFDENYLTIPYVQDFENYSYHAFPTGWTRFGSEPYVSTSDFAYSGTKSLYFAITSPMYAVLPPVNTDETPLSDLMLSFQMFFPTEYKTAITKILLKKAKMEKKVGFCLLINKEKLKMAYGFENFSVLFWLVLFWLSLSCRISGCFSLNIFIQVLS